MIKIDEETVRKCAKLAQVKVEDHEVLKLQAELEKIMEFVQTLDEVETEKLEPTCFATTHTNISRADVSITYSDSAGLVESAPESRDGYIVVPRIVE